MVNRVVKGFVNVDRTDGVVFSPPVEQVGLFSFERMFGSMLRCMFLHKFYIFSTLSLGNWRSYFCAAALHD